MAMMSAVTAMPAQTHYTSERNATSCLQNNRSHGPILPSSRMSRPRNSQTSKKRSPSDTGNHTERQSGTRSFSFIALKQAQTTLQPSPVTFKNLPPRIYDCILTNLERSHLDSNGDGCLTCFLRDLHSLSLTCRAWERAVRPKMYNKIHVHGPDSPSQLKKYKSKRGSRLKLLRRTLRERRLLANIVHELVAPDLESFAGSVAKGGNAQQEFIDIIASVVMVCPNLERLTGLTLPYNHTFDRLTYALSTRRKLKQHAWIIEENEEASRQLLTGPGKHDDSEFTFQFLSYHRSWGQLETLMIHSLDKKGRLGHDTYNRMLGSLPSLKHLSLSNLLPSDFNDNNLIALPHLKSLRLERVPGVTEIGLSWFCFYEAAQNIESLSLIEQNVSSLMLISKLLASLRCLRSFAISQTSVSPSLPDGGMILQPLLASRTLRFLHWDIKSPNAVMALNDFNAIATIESLSKSNSPNAHLAQSILSSGFPALEKLRAPQDIDPLGALQCVCRPTPSGCMMTPEDRYSLPRSSRGSLTHNRRIQALPSGNHLTSARIRAQMLMDMRARELDAGMKVVVTDFSTPPPTPTSDECPNLWSAEREQKEKFASIFGSDERAHSSSGSTGKHGIKVHEFTVPPCMGRITSESNQDGALVAPSYCLVPDVPGTDTDGGLINWKHYMTSSQTFKFLSTCAPILPSLDTSGNRRSRSSSSAGSYEEMTSPPSPTTPATPAFQFSRFSGFGGGSSNSPSRHSKAAPQHPPPSPKKYSGANSNSPSLSPPSFMGQPYWLRDTCKGEWNRHHRGGKDWWQHTERERPLNRKTSESVTLGDLYLYP